MRLAPIVLFALTASACAPEPFVSCHSDVTPRAKSYFDGTWAHTLAIETVDGPDVALPETVVAADTHFVFAEQWLYGLSDRSVVVAFRVSSNFDVVDAGHRCGPSIAPATEDRSWRERDFVRMDWSAELAGTTLVDLLPDLVVEPVSYGLAFDDPEATWDAPRVDGGDDTHPAEWSVTSDYLVYDAACLDASCRTFVRVRHRFVRR